MNNFLKNLIKLLTIAGIISVAAGAEGVLANPNKLLHLYRLYYLGYDIDFRSASNADDIYPFVAGKNGDYRLMKAEELAAVNDKWDAIRESYKQRSLFLKTAVELNQSQRISPRLVSHYVPLYREALERLPINERMMASATLSRLSDAEKTTFKQNAFLKSFLNTGDQNRTNLFIFSADWCESCREYRALLETYLKMFPQSELTLHSVVIRDPIDAKDLSKGPQIFDSNLMKELFPAQTPQDSIPRFIVLEPQNGKANPRLLVETEALQYIYENFLETHRGYLQKSPGIVRQISAVGDSFSPVLSGPGLK